MKKDYKKEIHELFEELRKDIDLKSGLSVFRLDIYEKMEELSLESNTKAEVNRLRNMIAKQNQKVFKFKYANKKIVLDKDGRVKSVSVLK